MITKHTLVAPAPEGTVPELWLQFLDRVFDGDAELIGFMKRLAGYALTGKTTEHKLFFLHGGGANGKSVFLNTLMDLYGDYARRAPSEVLLATRGDRHSTEIAGLHGARLVVGSELPKGRSWNEAIIKDLTGGDRMTARFMRQDNFDFDPQLSLMIAGNTKPSFGAVDEAIKRRVVLIPFEVTIPAAERDPELAAKLKAEGPAILRWAIDGAQEWALFGLGVPDSVKAASDDYMAGEDIIGQFLEDKAVIEQGTFVSNNDLHGAYTSWCVFEEVEPMGKNNFLKAIEERGHKTRKSNGVRGKQGLRLK
jgi:P4 family phage/plasmid primase-like protien